MNEDIDLLVIYFDRGCYMIFLVSLYVWDEDVWNRMLSIFEFV